MVEKMGQYKLIAVVLLAASVHALPTTERPSFVGCTDTAECKDAQCCVLGGHRYSSPQCVNFGGIGDPCRPYGTVPFNTTVAYPNGYSLNLTNVYFVVCLCSHDLVCDRGSSTCQDPQIISDNSIR
ncbi:astakine-like isoform X2 [Periplaneta americana]|uniref:astakine-like isoform X2 n=1 Tax=Periplaneta americana TaxID=6978 RepID=UPI0037E93D45